MTREKNKKERGRNINNKEEQGIAKANKEE